MTNWPSMARTSYRRSNLRDSKKLCRHLTISFDLHREIWERSVENLVPQWMFYLFLSYWAENFAKDCHLLIPGACAGIEEREGGTTCGRDEEASDVCARN